MFGVSSTRGPQISADNPTGIYCICWTYRLDHSTAPCVLWPIYANGLRVIKTAVSSAYQELVPKLPNLRATGWFRICAQRFPATEDLANRAVHIDRLPFSWMRQTEIARFTKRHSCTASHASKVPIWCIRARLLNLWWMDGETCANLPKGFSWWEALSKIQVTCQLGWLVEVVSAESTVEETTTRHPSQSHATMYNDNYSDTCFNKINTNVQWYFFPKNMVNYWEDHNWLSAFRTTQRLKSCRAGLFD